MNEQERADLEEIKRDVGRANRKLKKLLDVVEPTPPPEPTDPFAGLRQIADLSTKSDWHHVLIEDGAITDTGHGIRFNVPLDVDRRVRCELQFARSTQPIPGENGYEWELYVPQTCVLDPNQRGKSGGAAIMQTHTDVDSAHGGGYSGGMALRENGDLVWRVTGNKAAGEDEVFVLGKVERDRWYKIQARAVWRENTGGSVEAWLDGKKVYDVPNIVTCPDGATDQKFRLGWYADPCHGLDMTVRNVKVYG